jgi:Fe-S cluster assembly protein SufD
VVDGGDAFVDLTLASVTDTLVIEAPNGSVVPGVVRIEHQVTKTGSYIPCRTIIRVGRTAELSVMEDVAGDATGSVFTPLTQLEVADAATLRFVSIQQLGRDTIQLSHQQCVTGRDATLRSMSVALGGSYARVRTDATITGSGGFNELLAVYFGDGHQMHDFRTMQHHVAPRTSSELLFKGAVEDTAQSVYSGLIRIGADAKHTVANQTNRNLLLSPTASAESVPNLEIENNDVKCSHASAVGPVDEDHRYYLELRGVSPEAAERLIVVGFFADVLERSPLPGVADRLGSVFAEKFHQRGQ